jgi:hypothetical protein
MELEMEIVQLRGELSHVRNVCMRFINVLIEVKQAIDEDDTDEALRLINDTLQSP